MKDELERIATALESIAVSLMRIARDHRHEAVVGEPLVTHTAILGGLRESGPTDYDRNGASD